MSKALGFFCIYSCVFHYLAPLATAYEIGGRWTTTQTDGGGISRGDAITLNWSIVPDGESYERSSNTDLIEFMDDAWNVPQASRVPDLQNRSWWAVINDAYQQYTDVSGITMVYTPEQTPSGVDTGNAGDIRIGGEIIDGDPGGVLADNVYPNGGDMRIDTSRNSSGDAVSHNSLNSLFNLISHESGHGVGLGHSDIQGAESVMESALQTHFLGLQFDDIYAFNRSYGDPLEKNGGNDTYLQSTNLGSFSTHGSTSLGTDASQAAVTPVQTDWLGIDGTSDQDWFRFTVPQTAVVDISVTPMGPSYTTDEQGAFNASAQSDLRFDILHSSSLTHVKTVNQTTIGQTESVNSLALLDPGTYYVRVRSTEDENQFYQLDVAVDLPELKMIANRETGEIYLSGLTSAGVDIDGYTISSPSGGLNTDPGTWNSFASEGEPGWIETNHTNQTFIELQPSGEKHIDSGDSIYLGNFFEQVVTAPFGTPHEEDFSFDYTGEGLGADEVSGLVEFIGDPILNNLVLSVDPNTGEATLINDSQTTIDLDGYIIQSASGSLTPNTWTSLDDQELDEWREANPTVNAISELEPGDGTQLLPNESLSLGELFDTNGLKDLALTFLLTDAPAGWEGDNPLDWAGEVIYKLAADFNSDGEVDNDDLTDSSLGWQSRYGHDLSGANFLEWQRQYGSSINPLASAYAVPEPTSFSLILFALAGLNLRKTKL